MKDSHSHADVNAKYLRECEKLEQEKGRVRVQTREFRQRLLNFRNETINSQVLVHKEQMVFMQEHVTQAIQVKANMLKLIIFGYR
jgi:hypothetical protein